MAIENHLKAKKKHVRSSYFAKNYTGKSKIQFGSNFKTKKKGIETKKKFMEYNFQRLGVYLGIIILSLAYLTSSIGFVAIPLYKFELLLQDCETIFLIENLQINLLNAYLGASHVNFNGLLFGSEETAQNKFNRSISRIERSIEGFTDCS